MKKVNGRMGEWENGRMGEWGTKKSTGHGARGTGKRTVGGMKKVNGRMGEWENGRMGENGGRRKARSTGAETGLAGLASRAGHASLLQ